MNKGRFESGVARRVRKPLIIFLALVLVLSCAIGGTLAWLTAKSDEVKNTFTAAKLFANPETQFTLWEYKAVERADGTYGLSETEADKVQGNTYKVLPGVDIPKNPTVSIKSLEECAYLYIKVNNSLAEGMTYEIDDAEWEPLTGYTDVWVYTGDNADETNVITPTVTDNNTFDVNILKDKVIKVGSTYSVTDGGSLTFTAYMAQATGNGTDAATAWQNTFAATP